METISLLLDWDSAATPCLLMSIPRSLPSDSEVEALDNATSQSLRHRLSQHWRTFRFSQYGRQTKERARVERDGERYLLSGSVAPRGQHAHVHV